MQTFRSATLAIFMIGCVINATAGAAAKPEDMIKYRHAIMEAMSNHAAAIQMIAMNKVDARQHLQGHADSIANLTGELDNLFPEGSGGDETEALPAIWTEGEKFAAAIEKMREAAGTLREAAGSDDNKVVLGGLTAAGKACKGCHESFRAEEEHEDHD